MVEISEKSRRAQTSEALRPWVAKYIVASSEPERERLRREGLQDAQQTLAARGLNASQTSLSSSFNALKINLEGKRGRPPARTKRSALPEVPREEPRKPLSQAEVTATPPKILEPRRKAISGTRAPQAPHIEYTQQPRPTLVVHSPPVYVVSPWSQEQNDSQTSP